MKTWIGVVLVIMTAAAACGDETGGSASTSGGDATSASSTSSTSSGGVGGQGGSGGGGTAACQAVSDCRLEAYKCDTCTCLALPVDEPTPKCNGTEVECVIDPCAGLAATCAAGKCGSHQMDG